jgi:F-type H+-transporting ATPase subunit b
MPASSAERKGKRTVPVLLFSLGLIIFSAGTAWAASDGEGALLDLLARFINFTLLVVILGVVLKKSNILGFFPNRMEDIKKKMEQLQQEKEQAEARYSAIQKKLADFETEKQAILEEARKDGEAEKAVILSEAEKRVEQMLAQVESSVQREVNEAKARLRREVAVLAADKAREIISRELNEDDQDRLVSDFIENVRKVH